jgi:signal transduction histidine kinase
VTTQTAVLAAAALVLAGVAVAALARIRALQDECAALEAEAVRAVEATRERIAAELHQGVVQGLAGAAFELHTAADRLPADPFAVSGGGLRDTLERGERVCRDAVRTLRAVLLELEPDGAGTLQDALAGLAEPLRARGVAVGVRIRLARELPPDVAEFVFRAVEEALANVGRHAGAQAADVAVTDDGEAVTVHVTDDGRGMAVAGLQRQAATGDSGLRVLTGGVATRGGSLQIESEPGAGTRVSLWLPWE